MTKESDFAALMDEYSQRTLTREDTYTATLVSLFMDFAMAADYEVAGIADQAQWDISELADAPWGPQSMDLCISTVLEFAGAWVSLPERETEGAQRSFFNHWVEEAQRRLDHPRSDT